MYNVNNHIYTTKEMEQFYQDYCFDMMKEFGGLEYCISYNDFVAELTFMNEIMDF